jgi:hypothetical protein
MGKISTGNASRHFLIMPFDGVVPPSVSAAHNSMRSAFPSTAAFVVLKSAVAISMI